VPQLNFSIPADLLDKIDAAKPNYLDRKGFLCLLLDEALARGLTGGLNLPAYCVGAGTRETAPTFAVESSQELPREKGDAAWVASAPQEDCLPLEPKKNKTKNKGRKVLSYPLDFEEFWGLYQSLPVKAGKQSKPLALKEWQSACDEVRPEDLLRAVQMAMEVQHAELRSPRGFTVAMPDCFRWLRDCCYLALLEGHQTRQPELIIPGQTVL